MGKNFIADQREAQAAYCAANFASSVGFENSPYRLQRAFRFLNLAPSIRDLAPEYFQRPDGAITWHRHANHALSSQVCCLNFLMLRIPT